MSRELRSQARRDVFLVRWRADLLLRKAHASVSGQVPAIIERHAREGADGARVLDSAGAAAARADIEALLAPLYGAARGARSLVGETAASHALAARRLARQAAIDDMKARCGPELTRAMVEAV